MLSYRTLTQQPAFFRNLCGLSQEEFDALCREWVYVDAVARAAETHTREGQRPRRRAPGGGRKYVLDAPTRLLAALVWLRLYPTWPVLGFLFGVEESAVRRSTQDVLRRLEAMAVFPLEQRTPRSSVPPASGTHPQGPAPKRPKGRSLAEVIEEEPALQILIDSREQRIRRPKGWQAQKPYYSGKKKAHTLKCQAAVSLDCRVQAISPSVPGSTSDLTLLRASGVLAVLEPTEGVGADKGYVGIEQQHPEPACYVPHKKPPRGDLTEEQRSYNRLLSALRIIVEHLFARISRFGALSQVFRHQRQYHSTVVRVGAFLADRQIAACQAAAAAALAA
ncbi:MAG TPA: transposase family protein [Longimicrobiaceae bacterium]|nr:transposase family protein [Longimicrobiaceae bacterium]